MLTLYRRHSPNCSRTDRKYRRCKCPLWVQGTLNGRPLRQSLKMRSWEKAQETVRDWEFWGDTKPPEKEKAKERVTLETAVAEFFADATARHLREPTIKKFKVVLASQLVPFAESKGIRYVDEFDVSTVRKFRASWSDGAISAWKKLERLRSFFRFCVDAGYRADNPASAIKPPKITQPPTLPFSSEEMEKILRATDLYADRPKGRRQKLKAFVLLLRHSGLRIRDAMLLKRDRIEDGKLFLYTQKTGQPVWIPLPQLVLDELEQVVNFPAEYFFHNGEVKPEHALSVWERTFKRLFELAGLTGAHAHRFRDTFAVELLLAGVSLEDVSILLGHSSIRVTEKHYSAWVKARQLKLEEAVRKAWT